MSAAARRGYVLPVQGRPTEITTVRTRADPGDVDRYINNAVSFVDGQPDERWINCLKMDGDTYNMAVCPCFYPSIVCRAIGDDAPTTELQVEKQWRLWLALSSRWG